MMNGPSPPVGSGNSPPTETFGSSLLASLNASSSSSGTTKANHPTSHGKGTTSLTSTEIISLLKRGGTTTTIAANSPNLASVGREGTDTVASNRLSKDGLLGAVLGAGTNSGRIESMDEEFGGLGGRDGSGGVTSSTFTEPSAINPQDSLKIDCSLGGLADLIRQAHQDRQTLVLGIDSEAFITALSATPAGIEEDLTGRTVKLSRLLSSPWLELGGAPIAPSLRRGSASPPSTPRVMATASATTATTALDSLLPTCYNVQAPPHAATRIGSFTEETLFYMFYGMPRDRMQEMAARELTLNRGWRFHKGLKLWLMPGSATPTASSMTAGISALRMSPTPSSPSSTTPKTPCTTAATATATLGKADGVREESMASYIVFDAATWTKMRKELPVIQETDLESRFSGSNMAATGNQQPVGVASTLQNTPK